MSFEVGRLVLESSAWIIIVSGVVISFLVTYTAIPSIVHISFTKGLTDSPNQRKSHKQSVPNLGGVGVFAGMVIPVVLFGDPLFDHQIRYIFVSLLILLFIGLKDDILDISPMKKLAGELLAIGIIVFLGDIRITSFNGFLGIYDLPFAVSLLFSVFVFVVIINGMNLIDGIDGLASGVGILISAAFGIWFLMVDMHSFAAYSFACAGALLAFFRYNVFSKKNRIFLGDTGSLILGMVVSIFTVRFLESNLVHEVGSFRISAPILAFSVLIIPMIDTLRVFTLRLLLGKSPFSADRMHTHHQLLELGLSHLQSTLILLAFNVSIIALAVALSNLGNMKLFLVIFPLSVWVTSLPGLFIRFRERYQFPQSKYFGKYTWLVPITFNRNIVVRDPSGNGLDKRGRAGETAQQKDRPEKNDTGSPVRLSRKIA